MIDVALSSCPCCLENRTEQRCVTTPYIHEGRTEIYSDMLKDCFDIQLTVVGEKSGICLLCVGRLRDASDFKQQVERCQRELWDQLEVVQEIGVGEPAADVKSEAADDDVVASDEEPSEQSVVDAPSDEDCISLVRHDGARFCARSLSLRARAQLAMTCAVRLERLCGGEARDDRRATHEVEGHTDSVKAKAYRCDTCGKQFSRKPSLIRHVLRHTGTASSSKRVSRKSSITQRSHVRVHTGLKPYSCDICYKQFTRKRYLHNHVKLHTGQKSHCCHICNKLFTKKGLLDRHVRVHTGQKPYSCDICNKRFTQKGSLVNHERKHSGQKPYSCHVCKKRFAEKGYVNAHLRIHTGQKPYSCYICDKQFTQKGSLIYHVRIHIGQRSHCCQICNKRFIRKEHLDRHVRTHTGQKPYTCDICNKQFTRKDQLNKHVRIHTG